MIPVHRVTRPIEFNLGGYMPKLKRITTALGVTGALTVGSLALGAGVASAHPPGTSCQSVGVTNNGGVTVFYNCNGLHLAVNPPGTFVTANAFL